MKISSLKDGDFKSKKVLLRLDLNVPLNEQKEIEDNTRILETLDTIKFLLSQNAKVIILSHLGRPDGKVVEDLRLNPVVSELSKLLGKEVKKLDECIGESVKSYIQNMKDGDVVLLENTRFYPGEEANDDAFSKELASYADVFVNDAFGTVHRAHASTVGLTKFLPSYAGLLLEKEIRVLSGLMENPKKPLALIAGGAKIDTKIGILEHFLGIADYFMIGGALANTFLSAQGHEIGASKSENDKVPVAKSFIEKAQNLILPIDVKVQTAQGEVKNIDLSTEKIASDMKILDIGDKSVEKFIEVISKSETIIWNGPLGLYEMRGYENGTKKIAEALANSGKVTVLGGGDTVDSVKRFNFPIENFTHISTGGGAMLEFLEGKVLPGIQALELK